MSPVQFLAAQSPPAGGATFGQVVIAALLALIVLVPLLVFVIREHAGHTTIVGKLADRVAKADGLPRWAGLPSYLLILSALVGGLGVYWDVPIHFELGRDEGPLANPSHYPIYFALLGIFSSGVISGSLARNPLPAKTFRIDARTRVPMGSVLITVLGLVGVAGFPLDDMWHRLFGQDVTEWGPTHVMMIGAAVLSPFGVQLLMAEARQVGSRFSPVLYAVHGGMWLTTANAFLMEFELGLPQFPMLNQVVLAGLAATWSLVYARTRFGAGGALIALGTFLACRGLLYVFVLPFDLRPAPFLPYVAEAVLVELIALLVSRGYRFGAAAGLAVGTGGILAEWVGTRLFMPQPWPAEMLGSYVLYGTGAAICGGVIAIWQAQRLQEIEGVAQHSPARSGNALGLAGLAGALAIMALVAPPAPPAQTVSADLTVTPAPAGRPLHHVRDPQVTPRWVDVTVALRPADAASHAHWFTAASWQGGDSFTVPMRRVSDGVYRSSAPIPVYGSWKSMIRLHTGTNTMSTLPIYAPRDDAIPAAEISATSGPRDFVYEPAFLQRETKQDVPRWLWTVAYVVVGLIWGTAWLIFIGLYVRAARTPRPRPVSNPEPTPVS